MAILHDHSDIYKKVKDLAQWFFAANNESCFFAPRNMMVKDIAHGMIKSIDVLSMRVAQATTAAEECDARNDE